MKSGGDNVKKTFGTRISVSNGSRQLVLGWDNDDRLELTLAIEDTRKKVAFGSLFSLEHSVLSGAAA